MSEWTDDDEFPISDVPNTPLWSENYAFTCFDAQQDVAMIALLGRWPRDTSLWRELLLLSFGGDRIVCARNHGRAATAQHASAAMFRVDVLEPGRSLRLSYDGPAAEYSRDELLTHGAQNRAAQNLRIQLDFNAVSPLWNMSGHADKGEAIAGALHLEQVGLGRGHIEFAGQRRAIAGAFMNRDHSRGVRDLRPFRRHCWAQGWFADEQVSFNVYAIEVFGIDGLAMAKASISKGADRYAAEVVDIELIDGPDALLRPYRLHLRSELGDMHLVNTRAVSCLPIGVTHPWEAYAGTTPGQHSMMTFEEPVHWDWDGRAGIGWSERAWNPKPFDTVA